MTIEAKSVKLGIGDFGAKGSPIGQMFSSNSCLRWPCVLAAAVVMTMLIAAATLLVPSSPQYVAARIEDRVANQGHLVAKKTHGVTGHRHKRSPELTEVLLEDCRIRYRDKNMRHLNNDSGVIEIFISPAEHCATVPALPQALDVTFAVGFREKGPRGLIVPNLAEANENMQFEIHAANETASSERCIQPEPPSDCVDPLPISIPRPVEQEVVRMRYNFVWHPSNVVHFRTGFSFDYEGPKGWKFISDFPTRHHPEVQGSTVNATIQYMNAVPDFDSFKNHMDCICARY